MKRQIFAIFSLLTVVLTILATSTVSLIYYNFYKDGVESDLRSTCFELALELEQKEEPEKDLMAISSAVLGEKRITLVDAQGKVAYDTGAKADQLDNHREREEIKEAFSGGEGQATRFSDTLGKDTFYYARQLKNGMVLRMAQPMDSIVSMFRDTLPVIFGMIILMVLLSLWVSSMLTKRIMKPIDGAAQQLDNIFDEHVYKEIYDDVSYEELRPFLRKIYALDGEIKKHVASLQAETDTVNAIAENMHEGLIFLDNDRKILSINRSAKSLLGIASRSRFLGQNILHLSRNPKLQQALSDAMESGTTLGFAEEDEKGRCYRYLVSPVSDEAGNTQGVIIFIINVTQEVKGERMRRDFAANVSHELKTPLTSISGFAEMIENGMIQGEEDLKNCAGMIHKESGRMITLVEDIIRLSEIENQATIPEVEEVALDELANEVFDSLSHVAKEQTITLTKDTKPVTISGNRAMLYELLYNLCDNGIKYNRPSGTVTLKLETQENTASISVRDTGIGIEPVHLDRIFERFYRVDKSRSKQTGGTGLGLSIVKHIVETHHGSIEVQPNQEEGTTIVVSLPLHQN